MYAIIATGGKQYKVSEGDVIRIEKIDAEVGASVTFDQVLAVSDKELKVADDVKEATVTGTETEQGKARKATDSFIRRSRSIRSMHKSICARV